MMNDLTSTAKATSDPTTADIFTSAIHLHDSVVRATFEADVARSLILFGKNPVKRLGQGGPIDFGKLFTQSVGLDPRTFAEICISIGTRYITLTEEILNSNSEQFFLGTGYFSGTTLTTVDLEAFLAKVAIAEEQLATKLSEMPDRRRFRHCGVLSHGFHADEGACARQILILPSPPALQISQ